MKQLVKAALVRGSIYVLISVGTILLSAGKSGATCGDVNNVGGVNVADINFLLSHLFIEFAPSPPFPVNADVDGYETLTIGDLMLLIDHLFNSGPNPGCSVVPGPPPSAPGLMGILAGYAPAGSSSAELVIYLNNPAFVVFGFSLPIEIGLDDASPVTILSASFSPITDSWGAQGGVDVTHGAVRTEGSNVALFAALSTTIGPSFYIPTGMHEVGRVIVSYPPAPMMRLFTNTWHPMTAPTPTVGYPDLSFMPLVPGPYSGYKDPSKDANEEAASTFVDMHTPLANYNIYKQGDLNGDNRLNILDVNFLASYLFAAGQPPADVQAANTNCDGSLNILDLNILVSYLFAGGYAPCAAR